MIDKLLVDGIKKAKTSTAKTPCHFVFIVSGSNGKLLLGARKPAEKDVAVAKKALNGTIVRGICFLEGDQLVFQTPAALQATWDATARKVIKDQGGITVGVEFRKKGELSEVGETETEQSTEEVDKPGPKAGQTPSEEKGEEESEVEEDPKEKSEKGTLDKAAAEKNKKFAANLKNFSPTIKEAIGAKVANAGEISKLAKGSTDLANDKKFDEALADLDKAYSMAQAALKNKPKGEVNLGDWPKIREDILGKLKNLSNEIKAEKHEESDKAVMELQAVVKNITAEPRTAQQISELKKYLAEDEIVADVCELAFDIRKPLLGALSKIQLA